MKFCFSSKRKDFGKSVQVLAKLGDEIYVEWSSKTTSVKFGENLFHRKIFVCFQLSFRTANQSRSSYSSINFQRDFFQDWPRQQNDKEKFKCRISSKVRKMNNIFSSNFFFRSALHFGGSGASVKQIDATRTDLRRWKVEFVVCSSLSFQ